MQHGSLQGNVGYTRADTGYYPQYLGGGSQQPSYSNQLASYSSPTTGALSGQLSAGPYESALTTGYAQPPSYQAQGSTVGDVGGALDQAGNAAIATGNPYAMIGGAVAKTAGTGLQVYGKYQAREDAKRREEEAMAAYREQLRIEQEDRQREIARQGRQEDYFGADYSAGLEDRFAGSYGGYRQGGQ